MKKEFEELLEKLKPYLFGKLYEEWVAPNPKINFEDYANYLCRFYSEIEDAFYFISNNTDDDAVEVNPIADEDFPF